MFGRKVGVGFALLYKCESISASPYILGYWPPALRRSVDSTLVWQSLGPPKPRPCPSSSLSSQATIRDTGVPFTSGLASPAPRSTAAPTSPLRLHVVPRRGSGLPSGKQTENNPDGRLQGSPETLLLLVVAENRYTKAYECNGGHQKLPPPPIAR